MINADIGTITTIEKRMKYIILKSTFSDFRAKQFKNKLNFRLVRNVPKTLPVFGVNPSYNFGGIHLTYAHSQSPWK